MLRLRLMKKLRLKCRLRAAFLLCLPLRGEGGPLAVDEEETCTNSARNLNPILKNRFQGQITSHSQGFDPSNPKMLASLRIFRATSSVSSLCSLPPSPRRGRLGKAVRRAEVSGEGAKHSEPEAEVRRRSARKNGYIAFKSNQSAFHEIYLPPLPHSRPLPLASFIDL